MRVRSVPQSAAGSDGARNGAFLDVLSGRLRQRVQAARSRREGRRNGRRTNSTAHGHVPRSIVDADVSTHDAPSFGTRDIPYSGTRIQDDSAHDADSGYDWDAIAGEARPDDSSQGNGDATPLDEFLQSDQPDFDQPHADILTERTRSPKAKQYERKTAGLFSTAFKLTVGQASTLPDSAAILMYGPDVSERVGDLAAENALVARGVDMLTDGSENAAAALLLTAFPFVLQVVRNHEQALQPQARGIKVPFTKGKRVLRFKFGFNIGKRVHNMTSDPDALTVHVFSNPDVQAALIKQGIKVAKQR